MHLAGATDGGGDSRGDWGEEPISSEGERDKGIGEASIP